MGIKKSVFVFAVVVLSVFIIAVTGISFYMLDYSLAPMEDRTDSAAHYDTLYTDYPEVRTWTDSLRRLHALRDTFVTMPTGERHHALYIREGGQKTAFVVHGWRDCSIDFLYLAKMYQQMFGYNVVVPDLHASGLSDGDAIGMGWLDRKDMLQWLEVFKSDTIIVHGVSMGAATTMMMSGEQMPDWVRNIRFIEDCGYTSVWDEFSKELKEEFGLPAFPLMYSTSMLCKLRYGWSFSEASALRQVKKCQYPMLFIHGDNDTFVPTEMSLRLYQAKPGRKRIWITSNTEHAESYKNHREEYMKRVGDFILWE